MMNSQKGQAFPLALVALAIGILVVAPFLSHAGSSLIGSRIYEQSIDEQYSADAGVEYAIWQIQSGDSQVPEGEELELPQFALNSKAVNVTIANEGGWIYKITSTATSDDGSSTTIEASVSITVGFFNGDIGLGNNEEVTGDVLADGNITLGNNATINGNAYATGDITLNNNAKVTGDVIAQGDIELINNSEIGGNVSVGGNLTLSNNSKIRGDVCAGGNTTLGNNAIIYGEVYTSGNVNLWNNAIIKSDVYIAGDIENTTLGNNAKIEGNIYLTGDIADIILGNNARIEGNIYLRGSITGELELGDNAEITGDVYENYTGDYPPPPECPEMPAVEAGTNIQTWEISRQ
jgi:predicted acyltransferase (DUF342 family)